MRVLKRIGIIACAFIILFPTMLYFLQEKLIFLPSSLPERYEYQFQDPFDEVFLTAPDGARLNALHFKHDLPRGLILYFHGNAGNLSRWGQVVEPFFKMGFDVLIMDYRTYGKSSGKLSETALLSDAQLFYDYANKYYDEPDILLYGRSLGTGIATWLASVNRPGKLILESPFYSLVHVAQNRFPMLPVQWLLKYRLESNKYIQDVSCPVYIFHGTDDEVVPYESGLLLYQAMSSPNKMLFRIDGGGHNDLEMHPAFWEGIENVFQ